VSTDAASTVSNSGDGLWVSVRELARIKGVDVAAISRKVAGFVEKSLLSTRPGPRGAKLVNRAEYDRLVGQTGDPVKERAAETARLFREPDEAAAAPKGEIDPATAQANNAKRTSALYEAELKKLELGERLGDLIGRNDLMQARDRCGASIATVIERLPLRAAEMSAAVAKDGEAGARDLLRKISFDVSQAIAVALRSLAAEGLAQEAAGGIEAEITLTVQQEQIAS
jgi:hypothetical protein